MKDPPGRLLASGRAADVYDVGDGRVLRRYRDVGDDAGLHDRVIDEARVMRLVAEHGFPVPLVHEVRGPDIVMDRIDGPTMLDALLAAPWKVVVHARLLARLHRRLGRITAPDWLLASPTRRRGDERVLHLDLHPMNVILSPRQGPVVIDWTNAAAGPPGFDAALTYVKLATYTGDAEDGDTTGEPTLSTRDRIGQRILSGSFRRFSRRSDIDAYLVAACDHWLADPGILPAERVAVAELRRSLRS